jgi:glycosyltransferase involved in cell wall biosynthesis
MPISVIIPAHNESAVIERLLRGLTRARADDTSAEPIEIIVVCNGCTDDTAVLARQFGPEVRVIETPVASKSHALNLGDRAARGFPRFYIDADVVFERGAVRAVAAALSSGDLLAAAPRAAFDTARCSWAVRAFHTVWSQLPCLRRDMVGSGVYALSREGRTRFGEFPPVTADDAFVRLQFRPHERGTIESCESLVTPPRSLASLIRIKTRGHFGNYELRKQNARLFDNEGSGHKRALLELAMRRPTIFPAIATYLLVRIACRVMSLRRYYFGNRRMWERDDSSRSANPAAPAGAGVHA